MHAFPVADQPAKHDVALVNLLLLTRNSELVAEVRLAAQSKHQIVVVETATELVSLLARVRDGGQLQDTALLQDDQYPTGDPRMSGLYLLPTVAQTYPGLRRVLLYTPGVATGPLRRVDASIQQGSITAMALSAALHG